MLRPVLSTLTSIALLAPGAQAFELVPLPSQPAGVPWPTESWREASPRRGVDAARLGRAIDEAFAESAPARTRALLVVHRGEIVAERYAPGFDRTRRFHSWSMAKSVTQALVGILVGRDELELEAPAAVPEWHADGDPRGAVTLGHLLHMTSGVDNAGDFQDPANSVLVKMLFGSAAGDTAGFAASFPLVHEPGRHWAYSTATTMIVAGIIGRTVGGGRDGVLEFIRSQLFEPLGMTSAVPEFDAAGTFLGAGFVYATALDWARFGLLYLRDGVWEGRRILPEGWVDYSRTPAPAENNGIYGAHFWLNLDPPPEQRVLFMADAPRSIFSALGAYGQAVLIVPTHDLVVVRLGLMSSMDFGPVTPLFTEIIAAFPALADGAPASGVGSAGE